MDHIMEITEFDAVRYTAGIVGFVLFALTFGIAIFYVVNSF